MAVLESPSELVGDVNGPASAVDNALARFDGTSGKRLQNSGVTLDDNDDLAGLRNVDVDSGSYYGIGAALERFEFDGPGDRIIARAATLGGESGGQVFTYSAAQGTILYVGKHGHDSFDGTHPDRPKLTIAAALSAWTNERIVVMPGTYAEDLAITAAMSGATIEADQYGTVTITGNHTFADSTGGTKRITAKGIAFGTGASGTTIFSMSGTSAKNLTFTSCDISASGSGANCFAYAVGHGGGTIRVTDGNLTSISDLVMTLPTSVNLYVVRSAIFRLSGNAFVLQGGRLYVYGDKQGTTQISGAILFDSGYTSRCQLIDAVFARVETNVTVTGNADASSGYYETFVTGTIDYYAKPTVGGANADEFAEIPYSDIPMAEDGTVGIPGAERVEFDGTAGVLKFAATTAFSFTETATATMYVDATNAPKIGSAQFGSWPQDSAFALFGNSALDHSAAGNYAVLQSATGSTYINAPSGQNVYLRVNNLNVATLASATMTMNGTNQLRFNASTERIESGSAGYLDRYAATQHRFFGPTSRFDTLVGIGTGTIPAYLTITDSATTSPFNVTERSAAPSAPSAQDVYLDDGTNTASGNPGWRRYTGAVWEDVSAGGGGGGDFADGGEAGGADRTLGNTDAYSLGFLTNNVTRLLITATGDVSIPAYNLALMFGASNQAKIYYDAANLVCKPDAAGSGVFVVNATRQTNGVGRFVIKAQDDSNIAVGTGGGIVFCGRYTASQTQIDGAAIWAYKVVATSGNYGFDMVFGTRANGASIAERMRMLSTGNIGINESAPTSQLDVNGDIEVGSSDAMYFGDPTTDGTWRQVRSGDDFVVERREFGSYVEKGRFSA